MTEDPPAFQLLNEIGIIDQLAVSMFERAMPKGMTLAQFTVLNHFVRLGLGERSPAALANALQVTRPTMTSTLQRLLRSGLVSVSPDPVDGRAKIVRLTEAGAAMREAYIVAVVPLLPVVGSALDNAEQQQALALLRRLRAKLDAARD